MIPVPVDIEQGEGVSLLKVLQIAMTILERWAESLQGHVERCSVRQKRWFQRVQF